MLNEENKCDNYGHLYKNFKHMTLNIKLKIQSACGMNSLTSEQ
jgi:hypothetical protein